MNIINKIEQEQLKADVTPFNVGDTIKVHTRVIEGGKERIQIFQGIVIAKRGSGINEAFTVRKISYGEGVERVFPLHTPRIAKIEVVNRGKVRRAKLHYLRGRIGKDAMMDVALLVMEDGDTWSCEEPEKEVAALVFDGKCTIKWENESYDVDRPNPFDYNPSCLHVCKGVKFEIIAHGPCNIYIQKTLNEKTFPSKMYKPEDTDTWARGNKGELMGCIKRDVRTCFDLDNAPYSNMVLGEVVNLPGKWSSYPPHHHPQPECYFYRFDKPMGFGAGWGNGEIYETHHNGLAIITDKMHSQVTAPGYSCCYAWGIRHLPGDPWDKTRIDDEEHLWLLEDDANDHIWHCPSGN